jgi:hypothetical protein
MPPRPSTARRRKRHATSRPAGVVAGPAARCPRTVGCASPAAHRRRPVPPRLRPRTSKRAFIPTNDGGRGVARRQGRRPSSLPASGNHAVPSSPYTAQSGGDSAQQRVGIDRPLQARHHGRVHPVAASRYSATTGSGEQRWAFTVMPGVRPREILDSWSAITPESGRHHRGRAAHPPAVAHVTQFSSAVNSGCLS